MTFPTLCLAPESLDGFKSAVNHWLLSLIVFFGFFFCGAVACGVMEANYNQFCFSFLGLCCWF